MSIKIGSLDIKLAQWWACSQANRSANLLTEEPPFSLWWEECDKAAGGFRNAIEKSETCYQVLYVFTSEESGFYRKRDVALSVVTVFYKTYHLWTLHATQTRPLRLSLLRLSTLFATLTFTCKISFFLKIFPSWSGPLREPIRMRRNFAKKKKKNYSAQVRPRLLYLCSPSWMSCISRECQHNGLVDAQSLSGILLVLFMLWNSAALIESVGNSNGLQALCKRSKFFVD